MVLFILKLKDGQLTPFSPALRKIKTVTVIEMHFNQPDYYHFIYIIQAPSLDILTSKFEQILII